MKNDGYPMTAGQVCGGRQEALQLIPFVGHNLMLLRFLMSWDV